MSVAVGKYCSTITRNQAVNAQMLRESRKRGAKNVQTGSIEITRYYRMFCFDGFTAKPRNDDSNYLTGISELLIIAIIEQETSFKSFRQECSNCNSWQSLKLWRKFMA